MCYLYIFCPLSVHISFHIPDLIFQNIQKLRGTVIYTILLSQAKGMTTTMTVTDNVLIGERIKKQRLLNGYSRETLAEMAGITPRFCYDLELGLKSMSLVTLAQLASALNISTDYLLFGAQTGEDIYYSAIRLLTTCPPSKLEHLEQIISHYIQAVKTDDMD